MTSKLVTFRIPEDLYQTFQEKCSDEGQTASEKLRHFVDDYLYPPSQSEDAAPSETEEGKKPNTEERFSNLEKRITPIERDIEKIGETITAIQRQLDDIQETLSEMVGASSEDELTLAPSEINVEGEHRDRVQPGEQKEELEEQKEREEKEEDKGHWPFNVFFKEKEQTPKEEPEKKR